MPKVEHAVDAFWDGTMTAEERQEFEHHLATCDDCGERLLELMELDALQERRKEGGR